MNATDDLLVRGLYARIAQLTEEVYFWKGRAKPLNPEPPPRYHDDLRAAEAHLQDIANGIGTGPIDLLPMELTVLVRNLRGRMKELENGRLYCSTCDSFHKILSLPISGQCLSGQ